MVDKMRFNGVCAVFFLMSFAVCGCGLFEPRTPEVPGKTGTWIPPTTPEIVLENIQSSMTQKVISNYVQNFTTDFVFHPDPSDSIDLSATQPNVYDNWTRSVDSTVTQAIFDDVASFDLITFTKRDTTIFVDPDHCVFYYKYLLQVTFKAGGSEYFRGLVEYHLRREGGANWYVFVWIDKRDPSFPSSRTWGNLKGTERSRVLP